MTTNLSRHPLVQAAAIVFLSTGPGPLVFAGAGSAPRVDEPAVEHAENSPSSFEALRDRVRSTPLVVSPDALEQTQVLGGTRYAGRLVVNCVLRDTSSSDTLEVNFDHWNLAARACLLMDYGRIMTEPAISDTGQGLTDGVLDALAALDAEARVRIPRIVEAGSYAEDWKPFIPVYRDFIRAVEQALPPGNTPLERFVDDSMAIDRTARLFGLYEILGRIRIEPSEVASEMIRSVSAARAEIAPTNASPGAESNLLYACVVSPSGTRQNGSSSENEEQIHLSDLPIAIHARSWHPLAPTFFKAWVDAEGDATNADATRIVNVIHELSVSINAWVRANPQANTSKLDAELNRMAAGRGLIGLLESYQQANESADSRGHMPHADNPLPGKGAREKP